MKKDKKMIVCNSCGRLHQKKVVQVSLKENERCPICCTNIRGFGFEISVEGVFAEEVKEVSMHLINQIQTANSHKINANGVLARDEYFQIILEIKEIERISLGNYLEDKFQKVVLKNPDFIKILYKDIYKVLDRTDKEGDNDLLIENGDFVDKYGAIKLTGLPTNLHYALTWLHMKLVEDFTAESPLQFISKMEQFENDFLKINYDTQAYTNRINELNLELRKKQNSKDKLGWTWSDLNEIIELKPNFAGFGVNLNAIFSRLINMKTK